MITVLHFTCTIRRGGSERQLFTIYKYGSNCFRNVIVSIYKPAINYLDEYNVKHEDAFFVLHPNIFIRLFRFFRFSKKLKPDVVYARDTLSFLIAAFAGIFQSYKVINGSIRHGVTGSGWLYRWRTFVLHFSRFIIANSQAGLKANGLKRGHVLYNGLDEKFFMPVETEQYLAQNPDLRDVIPDKALVLISVANLVPYKDYFTVLKVLETLRDRGLAFVYFIVGEGPNRFLLEEDIRKRNLTDYVFLLGRRQDIRELLSVSDVFIHSSKGEGCSNAILEAMAAGLPVIATATGGTPEIVDQSYGRLFEFQNAQQLLQHLEWFFNNPAKIKEMGQLARKIAKLRFSVEHMIVEYEQIIRQVTHK